MHALSQLASAPFTRSAADDSDTRRSDDKPVATSRISLLASLPVAASSSSLMSAASFSSIAPPPPSPSVAGLTGPSAGALGLQANSAKTPPQTGESAPTPSNSSRSRHINIQPLVLPLPPTPPASNAQDSSMTTPLPAPDQGFASNATKARTPSSSATSATPPPLPPPISTSSTQHSAQILRSQVAHTLNKTLQLEHSLTYRELQSYEKQLQTLHLEAIHSRRGFIAAVEALRARRREMEDIFGERCAVEGIIRHLRSRLEGLRMRIMEGGKGGIIETGIPTSSAIHLLSDDYAPLSAAAAIGGDYGPRNPGRLSGMDYTPQSAPLGGGMNPVPGHYSSSSRGIEFENLQQNDQQESNEMYNMRRHSSPGQAFAHGVTPAHVIEKTRDSLQQKATLPNSAPLLDYLETGDNADGIDVADFEEFGDCNDLTMSCARENAVDNTDNTIGDDSKENTKPGSSRLASNSLAFELSPEFSKPSSTSSASSLRISTNLQSSAEETLQQVKSQQALQQQLYQNQHYHALQQQQQDQKQQQQPFMFPSINMTRLHSTGQLANVKPAKNSDISAFRRSSLGLSVNDTMSPNLVGDAPSSSATTTTSPTAVGGAIACAMYQRGQCLGTGSEGCSAQHICVRCGGTHPVILCKKDRNVCVKWNMEGSNLDNYLMEYIAKRRADGLVDDDLLRMELQLTHSLPSSTILGTTPILASGTSTTNAGSSLATTPNPTHGAMMLPPLPFSSSAVFSTHSSSYSGNTGNGGSSGVVHLGAPLAVQTSGLQTQQHQSQQNLGMRGVDHPMHIAAAQAAMRVVSGGGCNSAGSNGGRDPYVMQQSPMLMMGTGMYGVYGNNSVNGTTGPGKRQNTSAGGTSSSFDGASLLTESERMMVCRDYNNFKCESADEMSLGQVGSNAEQAFTLLDSIQSGAPIPSANFRDHPVMSAPESFEGPDVVSMDRFSRPLTSSVLRRAALQLNDHHTSLSHFAFAPPNGDDDDECREDDYRRGAAVTVASAGTMRLRQRYPRSYARMSRALGLQQQAPAENEQATLAGADWRQGDAGMDSNTASEEASVVNRLVDQVLIELGVGASGDGTVLPLPPPLPPPPPPPLRRDRQQQQHLRPRFTTVFQQRTLVAGDRPAVPAIPAFHAFAPHAGLFRDAVAMPSPLTSDRLDAVRRVTAAILGCEDDSLFPDATTTCLTFIRASPSLSEHYQFVDQTVISPAEIIGNNRLQQASQPARQLSGSGVNFQKTGELPYLEWLRSRSLVDSNGNSISNLNESVPSLLSANDCGGLVDGKETEACGFDIPEGGMEILMRLVFDADGNHRAMTPEDVVCVFEEWDSKLGCSVTAKVTSDVEIEVVPHLHDDKVSQKPAVRDVWRGQRSRLTSAYPATLSTHSQASAGTRTSKDVVPTKVLLAPAETHFRAVSESRIFASNIVKFKRALLAQQPKPTDPDTPSCGADCATEQAPPTATFAPQNFECEQQADKTRNDQTAAALPPAGSAAQSRAIVDIDTADGGAGSVRPEVAGPACSRGTVAADARSTRSSYYRRKLPESCTSFDSDAGRLTFAQAVAGEHMEIFFVLAMQFATQSEPAYCGLGTLVMVLNSLQVDPLRQWKGVWREVSFQRSLFFPGFTDLSHAGGTTKTFCKYALSYRPCKLME
ncbi:hypothetical protein HDU83_000634 [Entophlyctis luteolus]|nr:hypothetical protein HDU83_000634 [Entophlyctis luteolus]